ncbi:MAG: AAA family ATPase, partial [Candidatus Methylomirabilis sp.]|nr:AAA family ATPase [Deltaproteobacteria bacterium]
MEYSYERPLVADLARRLREPRRFLQVVAGPRQVGKTTLVAQALAHVGAPHVYESADGPLLED